MTKQEATQRRREVLSVIYELKEVIIDFQQELQELEDILSGPEH